MYKNILVPVDLSNDESQQKAILTANEFAKLNDATLHIMTVVPGFGMSIVNSYLPKDHSEKMMEEAQSNLGEIINEFVSDDVQTQKVVAYGTIYSEIVEYAEKANMDLIIMASSRPELKDYLLGPNAARVTRHAKCSTMVVRS